MTPLAIACNPQLDPYAAWQATNGAARCNRMSAIITAATCSQNRNQTYVNGQCFGCGGLDNQTVAPQQTSPMLKLVWDADKTAATARPLTSACDDRIEGLDVLDELLDRLHEDPAPGDDFDDLELDLDEEELLKLFPELAEDDNAEPEFSRFTEYQEAAPRYAVYRGRCKRCGGFMGNIRERQDDNVHRCLACGWRVSPDYLRNHALHAAGGAL